MADSPGSPDPITAAPTTTARKPARARPKPPAEPATEATATEATATEATATEATAARPHSRLEPVRGLVQSIVDLPPFRRPREIFGVYNQAGGSLLAEGLAYSTLFAGLTGLLFAAGVLGYLVPAEADRQHLINAFTGQLTPFAPIARNGLDSVAAHASAFSIVGLAGLAWGASHFYGALDTAIARVFARTPARGAVSRILRGFVSVFLLVGGMLSGIVISAIQAIGATQIHGPQGEEVQALPGIVFPLVTATLIVAAVAVVYRVVPNTKVQLSVLALPALVAGLALTGLTELLVYITPLLTGALSVFGGVAAVFAALAWLHLAFQVLLLGAAWTRLRLDDRSEPPATLT